VIRNTNKSGQDMKINWCSRHQQMCLWHKSDKSARRSYRVWPDD